MVHLPYRRKGPKKRRRQKDENKNRKREDDHGPWSLFQFPVAHVKDATCDVAKLYEYLSVPKNVPRFVPALSKAWHVNVWTVLFSVASLTVAAEKVWPLPMDVLWST